MKEDCLFSILIASYNNETYLSRALESILNQSYTNWEVVIVDDASTDNSVDVIEPFLKDRRVFLYRNHVNRGCGFTKNRCVRLAHGTVCGFLDPDDALTFDALRIMVDAHHQHPQSSLCYATHYICDQDLNVQGVFERPRVLPAGVCYLDLADGSISHFASFKKSFYTLTEGIDPVLSKAVDQDLYYKLEETGDVVFLNRPLYYYRIHQGGISTGRNIALAGYWNMHVRENAYRRRINKLNRDEPKDEKKSLWLKYHDLAARNAVMEKDARKCLSHSCKYIFTAGLTINSIKYVRRLLLACLRRDKPGQIIINNS